MALSLNPFSAFLGKFTPNSDVLTTAATATFLDRTHYSSSGHSGGGYHHYHYKKKKKKSLAMNALTLLSFLFFLNLLQNCIQEHMNQMNPTTIVMQMPTTTAAVRKSDRKGDDGGELFNNITFAEDEQSERSKGTVKIEEIETSTKPTRRRNDNQKRKQGERENILVEIKPTKATIFHSEEYQYTQVPVKLKMVERYSHKRNP